MEGIVKSEWDHLRKVVIHRPGIEMFFGLLDPMGSLYERAFSRYEAMREHSNMENILRHEFKVDVVVLKDKIMDEAYKNPSVRRKLVAMARKMIENSTDKEKINEVLAAFDRNEKYLDSQHFFNILLMNEGVEFHVDKAGHHGLQINMEKRVPLSNLYFMRDQQFVTSKGIVLSRMALPERRFEPQLTKFFWEDVMKVPILHEIEAPGMIEGGEFIPMGNFALVGIGSRTNQAAIDQLLNIDFDYEEIAVVHQPMHPLVDAKEPDPMINMHLDTYFNIAGSKVAVGCEILIKNAKVDLYIKEGPGKYKKDTSSMNLYDYITKKGFTVVPITTLEQMSYATNFLCIEDGRILAIEVERIVKDVLANLEAKANANPQRFGKLYAQSKKDFDNLKAEGQFFPHKKDLYRAEVDAYPIILKNLTGGYGGAHCMTGVFERV